MAEREGVNFSNILQKALKERLRINLPAGSFRARVRVAQKSLYSRGQ